MQTHLNKFLFLFFLLIPSISYSAGTITDNSDLLFTESIIENDEINLLSRQKYQLNTIIKPEIENDVEVVKRYYGYSNEKARQILPLLTPQQIQIIRNKVNKGGRK